MPSVSAIKAGQAFVEATLRDDKLQKGLTRVKRRLQTFGASIQSLGAKFTAGGVAALVPFVKAIKAAAAAEEVASKFNTVFGKNADAVREWGDEFAGQVGRGKREISSFLASTQDLLVPVGFEPGAAAEFSKQITQLAVDLGSFNDKADADVMRDLQAALTGSGETMKKYGVIVSEAAVKQELLDQGLNPKKATDQQKVLARLNIIMRGTTAAQGDATKTAGSWSNMIKKLTAELDDLAVVIGSEIIPVVKPYLKNLVMIINKTAQLAKQNPKLVKGLFLAAVGITALGLALLVLGGAVIFAGATIGGLASVIAFLKAVLLGAVVAIKAFAGALLVLTTPIGSLVAGLALVAAAVIKFGGLWDMAKKKATNAATAIKEDVEIAMGGVKNAFLAGDIAGAAKILWALVKLEWTRGIAAVKLAAKTFLIDIEIAWENGANKLLTIWVDLMAKIKGMWAELTGFVRNIQEVASGSIAKIILKAQGVDDEGAVDEQTAAAMAANKQELASKKAAIEAEKTFKQEQAKQQHEAELTRLSEKLSAAEAAAAADVEKQRKALKDLANSFKNAEKEAKKNREDIAPDLKATYEDAVGAGALGAFSGDVLARNLKASDKNQKKIQENTLRTKLILEKMLELQRRRKGLAFE